MFKNDYILIYSLFTITVLTYKIRIPNYYATIQKMKNENMNSFI